MSLNQLPAKVRHAAKRNSSVILAAGAGVGVLSTAYLSALAGYKTAHALESEDPYASYRDRARLVWRLYIPPTIAASVTIGCVVGVKRVDGAKALAAQAAMAISERAYSEYRDRVVEEFGDRKDKEILGRVAQQRIERTPPKDGIVLGDGSVLCCELFTGRYFQSDKQALSKAVNEINARMLKNDYATLDDFYYEIGLEYTGVSGHSGWTSDKLLELEFSSVLAPGGRPCLAFNYSYVKAL